MVCSRCRRGAREKVEVGGALETELVRASLSIVACPSGMDEDAAATGQRYRAAVAGRHAHAVSKDRRR
jgi:hypothetical protein